MDLSKLPDEEIKAIAMGDMSKVSNDTLKYIAAGGTGDYKVARGKPDASQSETQRMQAKFIADQSTSPKWDALKADYNQHSLGDYVKEPLRFAAESITMPLSEGLRGLKSIASTVQGGAEAIRTGSIDAGLQKYQQKQAEFQPLQSPMAPSAMGNMLGAGYNAGVNKLSDLTGRPDIVEPVAQGIMGIGALVGLNKARPAIGEAVNATGRTLADAGIATAAKVGITPEKLYASSLKQSTVIPFEQRATNVKTGLEGGYVPSKKGLSKLYDDINVVNQEIAGVLDEAATRGKAANATPLINELKSIDTAIAGEQARAIAQAQDKAIQRHMISTQGGEWMQKTNIPDASYYANLRKAYEALPPEKQIQGGLPSPETVTNPVIDNFTAKKAQLQSDIDNIQATGKTIPVADILSRLDDVKQRAIDSFGDNGAVLKTIRGFETSLKKHPSVVNGEIPIEVAQQMKVNTYKQLKNAYGELKGFEVEAKKAMARGAKEEIVAQIPELAALNAKDSTLINLEKVLFKAVNRIENRDMMGIGVPIKALAGGVGGIKGTALGAIIGLIDTPTIKANLAIALHKARGRAVAPSEVNAMAKSIKASLEQKLNDERGLVGLDINADQPLQPATIRKGEVWTAPIGKTHYDVNTPNKSIAYDATMQKPVGFVTPDGKFLDRMQSLEWLKENRPDVYRRLDPVTRKNGLESQAYSHAAGLKTAEDAAARNFMRRQFGR